MPAESLPKNNSIDWQTLHQKRNRGEWTQKERAFVLMPAKSKRHFVWGFGLIVPSVKIGNLLIWGNPKNKLLKMSKTVVNDQKTILTWGTCFIEGKWKYSALIYIKRELHKNPWNLHNK